MVRLGIGNAATVSLPDHIDWDEVEALAEKQGLLGVVYDGALSTDLLPLAVKLRWMGKVMQGYEQHYVLYRRAVADLADWYHAHGYRMMLLKGLACGMDWPKPEHRPCGDIDIYLFGQQKEADEALVKEKGVEIDNSHHHHTIFYWGEFMVENHYDFIDVHHRKSGPKLEAILKELGMDDGHSVNLYGEKLYLPSANLHALFLLYHTMLHFTSTEMSLRQLLDWGLFIKKHAQAIDWDWFMSLVEEFHLKEFFNIINAICIEDLGFDASIFRGVQFTPMIKDRVLRDTLSPEFTEEEPHSILCRFFFRYRRWKSHEWKHKLCFEESMWSIFWTAVWSHILKPKSI